MSDKIKRIFEIYEISHNPKEVVIFTSAFKTKGKLLIEKSKIKDDIITLMDAVVCPHFENCQCEENPQYIEWLNIFDKDIIAFSIIS